MIKWDKGSAKSVKGLHTRTFSKKKVYYLYYRTKAGVQRRPAIGECGVLTLKQARKIAREMLAEVAAGKDPSEERKISRAEMTVTELFNAAWNGHWSKKRFQKSRHAAEVKRNFENHILPTFGTTKLSDLTAIKIREWHSGLSSIPYTANRSLEVLTKIFRYAEEMEWRPQNSNPCNLVCSHKEQKRDRYASDEEIGRLGAILERESALYPTEVAFIYLLIFSGARPVVIERALWKHLERRSIDGKDFGILTVKGKTGDTEKVLLPPQAMEALDLLKLSAPEETITGIKMPRKFWARIRSEAKCPDLWARDWRRTFATVSMNEGFAMDVISELLNHKSTQTTKIYAKLKDQNRRAIADGTAKKIERLLSRR